MLQWWFSWILVSSAAPSTKTESILGVIWRTSLGVMKIRDVTASNQQKRATDALCLTIKYRKTDALTKPTTDFLHQLLYTIKKFKVIVRQKTHKKSRLFLISEHWLQTLLGTSLLCPMWSFMTAKFSALRALSHLYEVSPLLYKLSYLACHPQSTTWFRVLINLAGVWVWILYTSLLQNIWQNLKMLNGQCHLHEGSFQTPCRKTRDNL